MIQVAKIINTHGLKGECKLYLFTDDPEHRFEKGRILYLNEKDPIKVMRFRMQKGLGYAFFEGIDSIEAAEKLKGDSLYIPIEDLPQTGENEYYYHELAGCKVFNEKKEALGIVSDLLETGANLVLRVKTNDGSFLVPFVDAFVEDVNVEEKTICIKEMEGLR